MEVNHREPGRPHAVNGFSDDSMTQKENLPDPNSFTDPYYLHAILGDNERSQDPPVVGRDSQNSHTSYSEVIDSLKVSEYTRTGDFSTCHYQRQSHCS